MTNAEWEHIINDHAAYEKFYTDSYKKFYNYGKKFTSNESLIEDAIQEVFLHFWMYPSKVNAVRSFEAYCFTTFRYMLLKKIKEEKRPIGDLSLGDEAEFSIDIVISQKETDLAQQVKLQNALAALTARQREAIFLRFYHNLSYEEVADILQISIKSTYKIISRSLEALRENMPSLGYLLLILSVHQQEF